MCSLSLYRGAAEAYSLCSTESLRGTQGKKSAHTGGRRFTANYTRILYKNKVIGGLGQCEALGQGTWILLP